LESKCEELRAQVERLTKEKEGAFDEIERLKDQVKLCYLDISRYYYLISINFIINFIILLVFSRARVFCCKYQVLFARLLFWKTSQMEYSHFLKMSIY